MELAGHIDQVKVEAVLNELEQDNLESALVFIKEGMTVEQFIREVIRDKFENKQDAMHIARLLDLTAEESDAPGLEFRRFDAAISLSRYIMAVMNLVCAERMVRDVVQKYSDTPELKLARLSDLCSTFVNSAGPELSSLVEKEYLDSDSFFALTEKLGVLHRSGGEHLSDTEYRTLAAIMLYGEPFVQAVADHGVVSEELAEYLLTEDKAEDE
jgi:hypothetical protein